MEHRNRVLYLSLLSAVNLFHALSLCAIVPFSNALCCCTPTAVRYFEGPIPDLFQSFDHEVWNVCTPETHAETLHKIASGPSSIGPQHGSSGRKFCINPDTPVPLVVAGQVGQLQTLSISFCSIAGPFDLNNKLPFGVGHVAVLFSPAVVCYPQDLHQKNKKKPQSSSRSDQYLNRTGISRECNSYSLFRGSQMLSNRLNEVMNIYFLHLTRFSTDG